MQVQSHGVKARDNLVSMFLKRLASIHNRGKERLEQIREEQRAITEALLGVLGEVLDANDTAPDEKILGRQVKSLIQIHHPPLALKQSNKTWASKFNPNRLQ